MSIIAVVGVGQSGQHAARQLAATGSVDEVLVHDKDQRRQAQVVENLSRVHRSTAIDDLSDLLSADTVVVATPVGHHFDLAKTLLEAGRNVVSISDDPTEVESLVSLGPLAMVNGVSLVPAAAFLPGLACVLVAHAGSQLTRVDFIATAKMGTAGPACARQHHRAHQGRGWEWAGGRWVAHRAGGGRELVWFPDPVGPQDTYRAAIAGPEMWKDRFPAARRVSARMAATRRDRMTSRLPMLRPPHVDGGPGAIRVEVRGIGPDGYCSVVYGVMDHPSVAAGTMAAVAALAVSERRWPTGWCPVVDQSPTPILDELYQRGVRVSRYAGTDQRVG